MPLPKKMPRGSRNSKQEEQGRVYANRYKVIRRLGSGSFGTVFLVEDMKTPNAERKVLKEIYVGELQPDETVDAMREAKLLAKLNHPNIVKFMDSFIDREFFCIVTEYCGCGDLDDKITAWRKAGKTFHESLILAWFIQIVLAVQHMHEKRILHRDLKTRNIFLKNNMIKLGDFGISRILMGTSDMATTFTGTPYYMSPEVLKHEGYNHKSDIWSLGVVLYELCNLQHAFQGQSLMGVMYKIVEGEPPKLHEKYSKDLQNLYSKLLDKNPKVRPSAAEILKCDYIARNIRIFKIQMNSKLSASFREDNTCGGSIQRPQTRSGRQQEEKLYDEPSERPMTPMDRMKLRKQEKADKEAERIKLFMAGQVPHTQAQYSHHKRKQNQVSLPWVDDHPDVFSDPTFTLTESDSWDFSPPTSPSPVYEPLEASNDNKNGDTWGSQDPADTMSLTMVSDIPEDADLAETFYSQFEDDFEEDSGAEGSDEEEDEYSALVGRMEDALEHSAVDVDHTLSDDVMGQALTSSMRQQRIEGLRAECMKLLGKGAFHRAYSFLKDARFGDAMKNEDSIMDGLGKIVSNPRDCFLVDQLLFMEKQAEIAAMT